LKNSSKKNNLETLKNKKRTIEKAFFVVFWGMREEK
jgi:hypothetical protein